MQFETDLTSNHVALFMEMRTLLLEGFGLLEQRKPRITTYSDANGGICHMRTMPNGVDLGFLKGAQMNDPEGMLSGRGKKMRILAVSEFDGDTAKGFIRQAIRLNAAHKASTKN